LPDSKDWREQVIALAGAPEWIMDGNYSNTYDVTSGIFRKSTGRES
jgi:hypothetical protein